MLISYFPTPAFVLGVFLQEGQFVLSPLFVYLIAIISVY